MAETQNILDLPRDQFAGYLNELSAQGVDTSELMRQYRRHNSIFSKIYDWAAGSERDIANQGRRTAGAGLLSKEAGTTGMDALASTRLEPANFIAGLLSGGAQAIDAPAAAAQGLIPASDMPMEALGTAGMAMTGATGSMGRGMLDYDPNTTRVFAGPNSKTADLDALARARELSARRRSPDEIWNETGWFKGADGMWRYEIDDSSYRYDPQGLQAVNPVNYQSYRAGNFGDAVYHPDLLAAYPDLSNTATVHYPFRGDAAGEYMPPSMFEESITTWDTPDRPSVVLHEGMHGIQQREGFAQGGNTSMFADEASRPENPRYRLWADNQDAVNWANEYYRSPKYQSDLAASNKFFEDNYGNIDDLFDQYTDPDLAMAEYDRVLAEAQRKSNENFPDMARFDQIAKQYGINQPDRYISPEEAYRRLAGEVEARNVETRRNFTPEQRKATPPWVTQDTPLDKQIIAANASPLAGLLVMPTTENRVPVYSPLNGLLPR